MKYKLIKEYPLSPKLGLVVENQEFPHESYFSNGFFSIKIEEITPYPELWEKVEELDYEVEEVFYSGQIRKLLQGQYRLINLGIGFDLDYVLKNKGVIYSVKRLSDGEVFTIGDTIIINYKPNNKVAIVEISHSENRQIWINYRKRGLSYYERGSCHLASATKLFKTHLFTTEDGVSVFENDKYYFISNGFQVVKSFAENLEFLSSSKTFSTKEKADEYVLLNKPLLSLTDVKDLFIEHRVELTLERLKSLIKSKR
jgi:hypothetical protein